MNRRSTVRPLAALLAGLVAFGAALSGIAFSTRESAGAAVNAHGRTGEALKYASPVEALFSGDGKRLFVLCQGSGEVRVLDAATFTVIKSISVGRVPRGF